MSVDGGEEQLVGNEFSNKSTFPFPPAAHDKT